MYDPPTAAMPLVDAALRGTVVALLVLLCAAMRRDRPTLVLGRVGIVFSFGLIVQVISSTPLFEAEVPRAWQAPCVAIAVGNAVLFWIFVQALFDDAFELRWWHGVVWLVVASVAAFNCATGWNTDSGVGRVAAGFQRGVPLVFAVLAAVAAAATWRTDLVEKRRRLRIFIVVVGVAYTVGMLALRLAMPHGRLVGTTATVDVAILLAMVSVIAYAMLRVADIDLVPPRPSGASAEPDGAFAQTTDETLVASPPRSSDSPTSPATPDPRDATLADALRRLMQEDRAYRDDGMTVAALASRLAVPEYRLRRHINRQLGHRNFNTFVNSFRLDEARAALRDPKRRALPVLTIALEAGFQSIGPFNRAFKAATGLTPTEYRQRSLADS